MYRSVVLFLAAVVCTQTFTIKQPVWETLSPNGIQFSYPDELGISLLGIHYSIDSPLPEVTAGTYNYDITSPTNGYWIHENRQVSVSPGQTVYYWFLIIHKGMGYQQLEQSWTVPFESVPTDSPPTLAPPNDPITNKPIATSSSPGDPPVIVTQSPGSGGSDGGGGCSGTCLRCDSYPCPSGCDMNIKPCNGLVFEDTFDTFDFSKYQHEITMGGGGNWEFQYYANNRSNSYVRDNVLYLKPTLTSDTYEEDFVRSGTLDLWGASPANQCTGNAWWGCMRSGGGTSIVNPIQSARLRTVNSFSFKYGKVEVEAKMPTGDWIWPAIWMLPKHNAYGEWPASGEIDIIECRGNANLYDSSGNSIGIDQMGSTMHWGPFFSENSWDKTHTSRYAKSGTFGTEFHKYGLEWTSKDIKFFLDDEEILKVDPGSGGFWDYGGWKSNNAFSKIDNPWQNGDIMAPFDQEFYLVMNVAVGGTNYFSDSNTNLPYAKPWRNDSPQAALDFWNAKDLWYPTWNGEDSAMQIKSLRVWQY